MRAERIGYFHPERGMVRVKTGFSWPAFLFGTLWAFAKHLWPIALLMRVPEAAIWFCSGFAQAHGNVALAGAGLLFQLGYRVFFGRHANAWWRARLVAQGYRPTGAKRAS